MGDDEGLEEWNTMAREIVGMYRAVWVEGGASVPNVICRWASAALFFHISFMNNVFTMAVNEGIMEDVAKTVGKGKKKR